MYELQVPKDYTTAGALTLAAGVFNIITSGMLFISFVWLCFGVLWLIPLGIGIAEVITGLRMASGDRQPRAKTISTLGLVAGALNCNPVPILCEALAVSMLSRPEVAGYLQAR